MSVFSLSSTRIDALRLKNWTFENAIMIKIYFTNLVVVLHFLPSILLVWKCLYICWIGERNILVTQLHSRVTARNIMLPNCTRTYNNNNHFEGVTASRAFCDRYFTMGFIKQNKQFSDIGFFLLPIFVSVRPLNNPFAYRIFLFFQYACVWVVSESGVVESLHHCTQLVCAGKTLMWPIMAPMTRTYSTTAVLVRCRWPSNGRFFTS